jgi:hypothetical protein
MDMRRRTGPKAILVLVLFSAAQIGVQVGFAEPNPPAPPVPVPQQLVARLITRNNRPISVNGNNAATGASIVTGATIETGNDQAATVNLGPLGVLDIAPNTRLILTFDENGNVKVVVIRGCAILKTKKNTTGEVATEQGTAAKTDSKKDGAIDICFPPGASSPVVNQGAAAAAGAGAQGAIAGVATTSITAPTIAIAAAGTAVALTPLVQNNEPPGGQVTNPSPSVP